MAHLLDTDMVIDHLAGRTSATDRIGELAEADVYIGMVTYMEVWQGVLESADPVIAQTTFEAFLASAPVHPFSAEIARRCARLRSDLKLQGKRVRPRALDLITAATAIELDLTLVTRNTGDFQDIPGLNLY